MTHGLEMNVPIIDDGQVVAFETVSLAPKEYRYGDCDEKCNNNWFVNIGSEQDSSFMCKTTCERRELNYAKGLMFGNKVPEECGIPTSENYEHGYQEMNPTVCCRDDDTRQELRDMEQEWQLQLQQLQKEEDGDVIHCNSVSYGKKFYLSIRVSFFYCVPHLPVIPRIVRI